MKDIEKFLRILSEGMKTLAKGFESAAERVDALAKSQSAEEKRSEEYGKTSREAAEPAEDAGTGAEAPKGQTASETVFQIISRSRKGVDMSALRSKTGYDTKKIHNVIYKLKKEGKIKSAAKGVYVKS